MVQGEEAVTQQGFCYRYLPRADSKKPYKAVGEFFYYSKRFKRSIKIEDGMRADGATGAIDIVSLAWWIHDKMCNTGRWADGTKCTNWQASSVLSDILWSEGRWVRSIRWFFATFFLGGGEARKNGLFKLRKN